MSGGLLAKLPGGAALTGPTQSQQRISHFLAQFSQRGVVSPLKSASRSADDKVWTPWMAARGEPRQDVELSRPQADAREVSAVRSTDFPRGRGD